MRGRSFDFWWKLDVDLDQKLRGHLPRITFLKEHTINRDVEVRSNVVNFFNRDGFLLTFVELVGPFAEHLVRAEMQEAVFIRQEFYVPFFPLTYVLYLAAVKSSDTLCSKGLFDIDSGS